MYDKRLLKTWAEMETWDEHIEKNGGLGKLSSKEGFNYLQKEYFAIVEKRINCCKELLKDYEGAFLYYIIAELYDRVDLNKSPAYLYKRPTRYYALKALEFDPNFTLARELLSRANEWVQFLGGDTDYIPEFDVKFKDIGKDRESKNSS